MTDVMRLVIGTVGASLYWMFYRYRDVLGFLFPINETLVDPFNTFSLFLLTLLAVAVLAFRFEQPLRALFRRKLVVPAVAVLSSLAAVFLLVAPESPAVLLCLETVVFGMGFCTLTFAWALFFSHNWSPAALIGMAASIFLSHSLTWVQFMPEPFGSSLPVLVPTLSGLLWYAGFDAQKLPQGPDPVGRLVDNLRQMDILTWYFILFLFIGSMIRTFVSEIDYGPAVSSTLGVRRIVSMSVSLLMVGVLLWLRRRGTLVVSPESPKVCEFALKFWIGLGILFAGGLALGLIDGFQKDGVYIVMASRNLLDYFLWILLCDYVFRKGRSALKVFSIFCLATNAVFWAISYEVIPLAIGGRHLEFDSLADQIILISLLVLVSGITIIAGWNSLKRTNTLASGAGIPSAAAAAAAGETPFQAETAVQAQDQPPAPDPVDALSEQYGLTGREKDILSMFSKGNSMKRTAELLSISDSTVHSHLKRIYAKMDIHSKQELIDLVAGLEPDSARGDGDAAV